MSCYIWAYSLLVLHLFGVRRFGQQWRIGGLALPQLGHAEPSAALFGPSPQATAEGQQLVPPFADSRHELVDALVQELAQLVQRDQGQRNALDQKMMIKQSLRHLDQRVGDQIY